MSLTSSIVKNLIDELALTLTLLEEVVGNGSGPLWDVIYNRVEKMNPSTLGIICANGKSWEQTQATSLYHVHNQTWLDKHASGRALLRIIATTTLVAMIYDELSTRLGLEIKTFRIGSSEAVLFRAGNRVYLARFYWDGVGKDRYRNCFSSGPLGKFLLDGSVTDEDVKNQPINEKLPWNFWSGIFK